MKAIKSSDPRKAAIVAALKAVSGGTKVTKVKESKLGLLFQGRCMAQRIPGSALWCILGTFTVTASQVGLDPKVILAKVGV